MNSLGIIIVTYKFPKEKLVKLVKEINHAGIKSSNFFVRDNTEDNIGYAGAINEVLKREINNYKYFLILNPDIKIPKETIQVLLQTVESAKGDIVGPVMCKEDGSLWGSAGEIDKKRFSAGMSTRVLNKLTPVDFVPGAAVLIKAEVFKNVGFFQTDYFLYYEEVDFQYRAMKAGFSRVVNPKAKIIHTGSFTVGNSSNAMRYYMARNHLLFVERFAPLYVKIRELIRLPRTIWQAREDKYELLGIRDYFLRKFGRNKKILIKADLV